MKMLIVLLSLVTVAAAAGAQEKPPLSTTAAGKDVTVTASPEMMKLAAPTLSDLQKVTIQSMAKDVEIWKLRAQQAAAEYERASQALQQLLASQTPPGYQITDKLELVKVPEPPKKEPEKK